MGKWANLWLSENVAQLEALYAQLSDESQKAELAKVIASLKEKEKEA